MSRGIAMRSDNLIRNHRAVPLYVLQWGAGHQDPAVTARYPHPDTAALAEAGSVVGLAG